MDPSIPIHTYGQYVAPHMAKETNEVPAKSDSDDEEVVKSYSDLVKTLMDTMGIRPVRGGANIC